jgi:hypothetical protein
MPAEGTAPNPLGAMARIRPGLSPRRSSNTCGWRVAMGAGLEWKAESP